MAVGSGASASTIPLTLGEGGGADGGTGDSRGSPITVAGAVVTPNAAGAYILTSADGQTQSLVPGGSAITVSGTRYSLAPGGTALAVGSSTIPLPLPAAVSGIGPRPEPPLTVGSQTITPDAQGNYVFTSIGADGKAVATQTLTRGGVVTVTGSDGKGTGTVVSLGADGRTVVVGGITEVIATTTTTTSTSGGTGSGPGNTGGGSGIGGLVWSGIGGSGSGSGSGSGGNGAPTATGSGGGNENGNVNGTTLFTGGGAAMGRPPWAVDWRAWAWGAIVAVAVAVAGCG